MGLGALSLCGMCTEKGEGGNGLGTAGPGGVPGHGRCHTASDGVRWVSRGHWSPESSRVRRGQMSGVG